MQGVIAERHVHCATGLNDQSLEITTIIIMKGNFKGRKWGLIKLNEIRHAHMVEACILNLFRKKIN